LREPWHEGFAARLESFWADEVRHSDMFRRLNRRAAPELYAGGDFHFIRVPRALVAVLRAATRRPRLFPLFLWLMLLQEERSLHYSGEYLRRRAEMEPAFLGAYRAHLVDEAG